MRTFYGRKEELQALHKFLSIVQRRRTSQMVAVIGRRRVGKTTLMLKAFEGCELPVFYFFADANVDEAETARAWLNEVSRTYAVEYPPALTRPEEVIGYLMQLTQTKPAICIIDECQNLNQINKAFWSQLQRIWDTKKDRGQLLLVMSGSIISAMEAIFGESSQPLFGRLSGQLMLKPFNPREILDILRNEAPGLSPRDILTLYAVTGGVAKYLELLIEAEAMAQRQIVEFIFSNAGGWLRSEGAIYLANEFRADSPIYLQILKKVAAGKTRWNEIQDGIDTIVSPYISRLEQFRLLEKNIPFGAKAGTRNSRYRVVDPYFHFWLKFVDPLESRTLAEANRWGVLIEKTLGSLSTYLGRALETWYREECLSSGEWIEAGAWWDKRGENEIDLVAMSIDRKTILFGEAKLNPEKFNAVKLAMKVEHFFSQHPELRRAAVRQCGLFPEGMGTSLSQLPPE